MGKNELKKHPKVKNYEVWSKYLCEIFEKPIEERDDNDKKKFQAYFKFSFPFRREFLTLEKEPTIKQIKKIYPYLFHKDQVFMEFELISEKSNMFEVFKRNVEIYAPEIMRLATASSVKDKIEHAFKKGDEETRKWIEKAGSLLLLPGYMEEERKGMLVFVNEAVPSDQVERPYISCDKNLEYGLQKEAKFKVIIEDNELCTVNNLLEAFFALMAAYYIFNAVYPATCMHTFYCLEKLYVEYSEDSEELEPPAIELFAALEKFGHKKKGKNSTNSNS